MMSSSIPLDQIYFVSFREAIHNLFGKSNPEIAGLQIKKCKKKIFDSVRIAIKNSYD